MKKISVIIFISFLIIGGLVKVADIYDWPPLPMTEYDREIITETKKHFILQSNWNKEDDRVCSEDEKISLYCALYFSSISVSGSFHHESAVMESVRKAIVEHHSQKRYPHILMDFNNDKNIDLEDIEEVLDEAQNILDKKWKKRNTFPYSFYDFFHTYFRK